MNRYLSLFLSFLKIGAFSFGGGYAMIPLIENEFVTKRKWITEDEFLDMTAISESTPGPMAVNSATYVGCKIGGVIGSVIATLAVCLPSFIVIYVISLFLDKFLSLKYVAYAFRGIHACVVYLIISSGIKILKTLKRNAFNIIISVSVLTAMTACSLFAVNFSSVYFILICGFIAVLIYAVKAFTEKRGAKK